jgi:phosphatidate cytidylyltransferase
MIIRILSAIVMAPIVISAVWFGSPYFEIVAFIVSIAAVIEWYGLVAMRKMGSLHLFWVFIGLVYIIVPIYILVWLRNYEPAGLQFVLWFFVVIWATDTGAYFSGKIIGGPKLAPRVSPNKTWAGFFGGIGFAVIMSLFLKVYAHPMIGLWVIITAGVLLSIIGQFGDLLESWCKRRFGVKESGSMIPGHGGILDRIDAILLSAPIAALMLFFFALSTNN